MALFSKHKVKQNCTAASTTPGLTNNRLSSGLSYEETFDYVLFCGGHHADPNWPKPWPGQEEFQGRIIHSHSYKHSGGFEEKVNVGVGIGNSGVDVACDLSSVSKQV